MVSGGLSSSRASEATQPRQPVAPTTTMAPTVLELVLTLKVEAPATPVPEEVSVAPEPLADEPATSKATPTTRQLVAPDSTPLQSILVDAEYRSLRELGGLSRNDRLTRAWRSGVALRGWYFDQAADSVLPAPPAKITVWGYIVQGGQAWWARTKTAYTKAARLHSGPKVGFTFCSQCELRVFCLGISHALIPTEINATRVTACSVTRRCTRCDEESM